MHTGSVLKQALYAYTIYSAALTPVILAAFYSRARECGGSGDRDRAGHVCDGVLGYGVRSQPSAGGGGRAGRDLPCPAGGGAGAGGGEPGDAASERRSRWRCFMRGRRRRLCGLGAIAHAQRRVCRSAKIIAEVAARKDASLPAGCATSAVAEAPELRGPARTANRRRS